MRFKIFKFFFEYKTVCSIILLYTRPRTDVVKKGWYLGKRAKGIDIGLQGACKGEIRNITIPPHLMFGIEKDSEFIAFDSHLCSTCTIHASNDK